MMEISGLSPESLGLTAAGLILIISAYRELKQDIRNINNRCKDHKEANQQDVDEIKDTLKQIWGELKNLNDKLFELFQK